MALYNVKTDDFENEVLKAETPVLVDFWASWCGPCRMLAPTIEELADELDDVKVCEVNVDEEPELAEKYDVMSIPTLLVIKDGETVSRSVGVQSKDAILNMLGK